jgi:hypothetical protein
MPDSIMYYEDHYVLLSPTMQQRFVDLAELKLTLQELLMPIQQELPRDLEGKVINLQVECLLENACEIEAIDGKWQWYAVRLEK